MQVATTVAEGERLKQDCTVPMDCGAIIGGNNAGGVTDVKPPTAAAMAAAAAAHNLLGLSALAALQPNLSSHLVTSVANAAAAASGSITGSGAPMTAIAGRLNGDGGGAMSPGMDLLLVPTDVEAKLIDYRGHKVAGFEIDSEMMVCLPQTYELFLKNLVGGLHTVYTKLKRLDITPRVCNVEQVRALRSLGAIQPGVNRCKLISCKDFDALYEDCTSTNSSRPGRPPKRSPLSSSGGGSDAWPINLTKKPKVEGFDAKQTAATMSMLNPQTSGVQHLMPFLPLAQQLMMSQMMTAAMSGSCHQTGSSSAIAEAISPTTDSQFDDRHGGNLKIDETTWNAELTENGQNQNGNPLNLKVNPEKASRDQDSTNSGQMYGGRTISPTGADQSEDDEANGEPSDVTDNSAFFPSAAAAPDMSTWLGMLQSLSGGSAQPPAQSDLSAKGSAFGMNVCSLLQNIVGLIEIAQNTARVQEQQLTKENGDLSNVVCQLQEENKLLDNKLKEERRIKKIYLKRWKKANRGKTEIQNQLLKLLEAEQQKNENAETRSSSSTV